MHESGYMKEMTTKEAKESLRANFGMTLTKRDGEFRVNYIGGDEATAYCTEDMADAINTGIEMRRWQVAQVNQGLRLEAQ
jgi:hypothetical protein